MPMYEKGSVRAEPRSKQQERMKKIMKKFLSSLLALTMILSLVIVPANATETPTQVAKGSTVQLNAPAKDTTVKVDNVDYTVTSDDPTYAWSSNSANATVPSSSTGSTVTVTGVSAGNATITCRMTEKYTIPAAEGAAASTGNYVKEVTYPITVNDAFLASDVQSVTVNGRTYSVSDGSATVFAYGQNLASATWSATLKNGYDYDGATYSDGTLTVKADGFDDVDISIVSSSASTDETLTVNSNTEALSGSTLTLSVSSNRSADASNRTYAWSYAPKATPSDTHSIAVGSDNKWNLTGLATDTTYVVTCTANYGTKTDVAHSSFELTITDSSDYSIKLEEDSYTLQVGDTLNLKDKVNLYYQNTTKVTNGVVFSFESNKHLIASVGASSGEVKALSDGTAKITVTAKYTLNGAVKEYTKDITIVVNSLSATFDKSVTNGDDISYDDDDVVDAVVSAINKVYGRNTVSSSNISTLTITSAPATKQGDLYVDGNKVTGTKTITDKDIRFDAYEGFLGDATFVVRATTNKIIAGKTSFDVTLKVTVTGDDTINATVTGSTANSSVSFKVSDAVDYDTLFVYGSKTNPSTSKPDYDGNWNATGTYENGWERCSSSTTITVPSSKFSSGKATLYVIGLDKYGVASTGTITVSQKSYDIEYNVVAGKSVNFDQKAFDSFLADYAEDNDDYNPKKDEITFDHAVLTSSVPSTKNEGTLYDGSTEITSSNKSKTKMTDMDKVSFDTVSKPSKDTITLTFKVYGEVEKPNSRKPEEVKYDVNVVISVVKEDITYTVGIDDTVQLTARDFVNFLQDARTSYRKAELDYVKFDVSGKNVSSYAYGGLYRSYSSYSTGKLADSTDKFYYEPSRTQYDLADVAYHTTRWAEAGKTVYIPFTVYGTKNEEASGTMAITIAQTMNFIDVKASDFFYEPVKWAVNNKITNGTSSTTFSPYKNCNRAEIVTFLWRAAGTPEPTVTRNPFTDVNSVRDASYYKAILWASQKGITAGTTATTFSPYQECTRSQIVTFLYRYAGKPSGYYSNPFKDVSSVNEASYYNAILWAVGKGITQGTSTTTFSPYASCTRGEAVTFLYRYVNGVK